MNGQSNAWAWVIGVIVVLIIIGGIWWAVSGSGTASPAPTTTAGQTAQTTGSSSTGY